MNLFLEISSLLGYLFFLGLLTILGPNIYIFFKKHGRSHRSFGLAYLVVLIAGFLDAVWTLYDAECRYYYDIVFGVLGVLLTLSAANDFQHKNIENSGSGTLDSHTIVTYNEMIEHSFYQGLNLIQIMYIHWIPYLPLLVHGALQQYICQNLNVTDTAKDNSSALCTSGDNSSHDIVYRLVRCILCALTVTPWLIRSYFPVHSFSQNWTVHDDQSTALVRALYKVKKYQYVFYKHFLLFGLNMSIAMNNIDLTQDHSGDISDMNNGISNSWFLSLPVAFRVLVPRISVFRLYWMLLNTSYVMEFFLQTLVKKNLMKQRVMLVLQHILMLSASIPALYILQYVDLKLAVMSLIGNFAFRGHDMLISLSLLLAIVLKLV